MKSSKYLIAGKPPVWTDSLADYYSKKAADLERNLQDSINQRNQEVKIAQDESFKETLSQISQFSAKAASLVQTVSTLKKKEDKELIKDTKESVSILGQPWVDQFIKLKEEEYAFQQSDFYLDKNSEDYKTGQGKIDSLAAGLNKFENDPIKSKAAYDILNASGRRLSIVNEILGQHAVTGLT